MSSQADQTVQVSNLGGSNETEIREFFSFCGKIQDLKVEGSNATVVFEKSSAARTALLLDGTQLNNTEVHVTAEHSSATGDDADHHDDHHEGIRQEDKPRTRVLAEAISHGYVLSDAIIQRAIAFDQKNGVSNRFTKALTDFDSKYRATERTRTMDDKYQVSNKAYGAYNQAYNQLSSYFEAAMGTPSGQKVRQFYEVGQKQVMDVHNEAMHLAKLKKQGQNQGQSESSGQTQPQGQVFEEEHRGVESSTAAATEPEKKGLETEPAVEKTEKTETS